jgi:hypothetical protein
MSEQSQLGPSQNGTVVLDIGGEIGALILLTGPDLLGAEIEISPETGSDSDHDVQPDASSARSEAGEVHTHDHGGQGHQHDHAHSHNVYHRAARTHVAVRERRGPGGTQYAAIYFGLRQGDYRLWNQQGEPADIVRIVGGHVAELDWR